MHTLVKVNGFRGKTTVVLTLLALLLMLSGVAGFGADSASAKAIPSNCIVDDSNGNQLQFDKTTGAYTFTDCGNFTLSGVGTVTIKGSTITLKTCGLRSPSLCGGRRDQQKRQRIAGGVSQRSAPNDHG